MSGNDYGKHVGRRDTALITTAAAFAVMHTGFERAVSSRAANLGFSFINEYDSYYGYDITRLNQLSLASVYGALLTLIISFLLGDILGRKKSLLLGLGLSIIGAALEVSSFNYEQSVGGRVLVGLGQGFELVAGPIWVAEAASPMNRGGLVVLLLVASQFGSDFGGWIMYGFEKNVITRGISAQAAWRAPLGLQFLFLGPAVVAAFLAPESPKAEEVKGWGGKGSHGQRQVIGPYGETMDGDRHNGATSEIRYNNAGDKAPRRFWRLFLGIAIQCMAPLTGQLLTSIVFWASDRYYTPFGIRIMTTMVGVTSLLALVLAVGLIDKVGRRLLLLGSALGQTVCWAVLLAVGYLSQRYHGIGTGYIWYYGTDETLTHVGVAFVYFFTICFGLGFQAVAPLYATEINTLSLRTKGLACSWFLKYGLQIMNTYTYNYGILHLEWRYLIIWLVLNLFFAIIIWAIYPETSRRSLEGIDTQFARYPRLFVGTQKGATSAKHRDGNLEDGDNVPLTHRDSS